jgi:hypothetical protein
MPDVVDRKERIDILGIPTNPAQREKTVPIEARMTDLKAHPAVGHLRLWPLLVLARYYQSLLDSGKFERRAALARFLGVSRTRVT